MNHSIYNVEVDGPNGEKLLFNTSSGAFASLDAAAFELYRNPSEVNEDDTVQDLMEYGFLTNLSPDEELQVQQSRFDRERENHNTLSLAFGMTYACNYKCPYCYEQNITGGGRMSDETVEDIFSFVEECYERNQFQKLWVEWYGGDPSLALDRVQELSEGFIEWCDEHDVIYEAMMLTNCLLIDDAAVQMLKRCRVSEVFLTIDGPEEIHNKRRIAADGSNSYQVNIEAAKMFVNAGIRVNAGMNVDKNTYPLYPALRDKLRSEVGIELSMNRLCDYGDFYGTRDFRAPEFDLLSHEEYCQIRHDLFAEDGMTAQDIRDLLRPVPRFCRGQLDDYYVIDCYGDVYKCDGWMGQAGHKKFNLSDIDYDPHLHEVTHDATRDEECSKCFFLPICHGNCTWERHLTGMPCHPLKDTIELYLNDYRACFGEEALNGFTLLAPPFSESEIVTL